MATKKKAVEQPKPETDIQMKIKELQELRKISSAQDQIEIDKQLLELTEG